MQAPPQLLICSYYLAPQKIRKLIWNEFGDRLNVFNIVYVDNAKNGSALKLSSNERLLEGSNSLYDWSAYREGVDARAHANSHLCSTIFLNDTLFLHYPWRSLLRRLIECIHDIDVMPKPVQVGHATEYAGALDIGPWGGNRFYVSSYCFALNRQAMNIFLTLPEQHTVLKTVEKSLEANITLGRLPVQDGRFLDFLRQFYGNPLFGQRYMKKTSRPMDAARKRTCVFFEHRLSGEVYKADGFIVPIHTSSKDKLFFRLQTKAIQVMRRWLGLNR